MHTNSTGEGQAEAIVAAVESADWPRLSALVEDMQRDPTGHLGVTLDLALIAVRGREASLLQAG